MVSEETSGRIHLAVSTRRIACESPGPNDAVTCQGCRHGGLPSREFPLSGGAIFSAPEPGRGIISASCLLSAYTIQHPTQDLGLLRGGRGDAWGLNQSRIVNQAVGVLIGSSCREDQAGSRPARLASHRNGYRGISADDRRRGRKGSPPELHRPRRIGPVTQGNHRRFRWRFVLFGSDRHLRMEGTWQRTLDRLARS